MAPAGTVILVLSNIFSLADKLIVKSASGEGEVEQATIESNRTAANIIIKNLSMTECVFIILQSQLSSIISMLIVAHYPRQEL
jgi:hypothetical protein